MNQHSIPFTTKFYPVVSPESQPHHLLVGKDKSGNMGFPSGNVTFGVSLWGDVEHNLLQRLGATFNPANAGNAHISCLLAWASPQLIGFFVDRETHQYIGNPVHAKRPMVLCIFGRFMAIGNHLPASTVGKLENVTYRAVDAKSKEVTRPAMYLFRQLVRKSQWAKWPAYKPQQPLGPDMNSLTSFVQQTGMHHRSEAVKNALTQLPTGMPVRAGNPQLSLGF